MSVGSGLKLLTPIKNILKESIMEFIRLLEAVVICLFIISMITQVIVPLWHNRPTWPIFRATRRDLEKAIVEINELEDEQQLAKTVRTRTSTIIKNEGK
jgi:hypothetical protein